MKIIVVAMLYSYGIKDRGYSYEYFNYYQPLKELYDDVQFFDYLTIYNEKGKIAMNQELLRIIKESSPDLVIFSLYTDQFIPEVIEEMRQYTTTVCIFFDDGWRVEYSRFWAGHFDWFTTSSLEGRNEYQHLGFTNALYFQYACNTSIYRRQDLPKEYDVSFVGAFHPYRNWLVRKLQRRGINVYTAGFSWPNGTLSQEDMIRVINQSKINLNLSNSNSWDIRYLSSIVTSPRTLYSAIRSKKNTEQMKGRHVEINGCGGFQLSYYVSGLEHVYEIGKEISVFLDADDLVRKTEYFLTYDDERETIAENGYQRTLAEHTSMQRFQYLIESVGLKA